jgi:membrane-associated protease RseP (regulator of RpoE activity)
MSAPFRGEVEVLVPPPLPAVAHPPERRERWWLHGLLLFLTLLTTTLVGAEFAASHDRSLLPASGAAASAYLRVLAAGLTYSLPLLAILLSHEMGHYLMCRHYGIDASPPYFIPIPLVLGTMGAFIRIREPMRRKNHVFDVGIAGPIAGFVVTLPILVYGISQTVPIGHQTAADGSQVFQYPLLVTIFQKMIFGSAYTSYDVYEHPTFMAGWAGLFVTAFNLIPLSQLDGGHALYAVAGRRHRLFAIPVLAALAVLGYGFPSWWVLGVLVLLFGLRHPPVADEDAPLSPGRRWVAAASLAIFVLCFMPTPIKNVFSSPSRPPVERRGTVVHELHLHRGAEDARLHPRAAGAERRDVVVEERLGHFEARRASEAGPPPS